MTRCIANGGSLSRRHCLVVFLLRSYQIYGSDQQRKTAVIVTLECALALTALQLLIRMLFKDIVKRNACYLRARMSFPPSLVVCKTS